MTPGDDDDPERGGDDILAAEYVLGVLPVNDLRAVAGRIESDRAFALLVEGWENNFSSLNSAYAEIAPPASLKSALDARLFGSTGKQTPRSGIFQSIAFWRALSGAALAGLLLSLALPFLQPGHVEAPSERLVASLVSDESDVRYLVIYEAQSGKVALSHVSGDRDAGRDFELWVIEGENPPVSLGVIPIGANAMLPVAPDRRASIESGALFAISLEPAGGSPTGAPTGPVLAVGDLRSI